MDNLANDNIFLESIKNHAVIKHYFGQGSTQEERKRENAKKPESHNSSNCILNHIYPYPI